MPAVDAVRSDPVIGYLALAPMVETMLTAAMERLEAEATAARAEAEAVVAGALRRADAQLRAVSADLRAASMATIAALDPAAMRTPAHLRGPGTPSSAPAAQPPVIDLTRPASGDGALLELDQREASDLYAYFWREAEVDRPVRERLRRWVQPRPPL